MKTIRMIITAILVLFISFGWISFITSQISSSVSRKNFEKEGTSYYAEGLYQKSIESFENAQKEKYKEATAKRIIDAKKASFYDGTGDASDYTDSYLDLCRSNPQKIEYWSDLLRFCIQEKDYNTGFTVCKTIEKLHVDDPSLYELTDKFEYSFSEKDKIYNIVSGGTNGYYSAYDGKSWRVICPDNKTMYEEVGPYIGEISSNNDYIIVYNKDARLIDKNEVVQAILSEHTDNMRAFGDGFIPMQQKDGLWNYYNIQTKTYSIKGLKDASSFQDGIAAVKRDSSWHIIDTKGKDINKIEFSDVKLYDNGEFIKDGMFVAAVDGIYNIYDENCSVITSINAHNMDGYYGGYLAYCDNNGKWGFINNQGEVVIKPQFKDASSFSNGIGGVSNGSKWAFINEAGRVVSEYRFLYVGYNSSDHYCPVGEMNNEYFMIHFNYF